MNEQQVDIGANQCVGILADRLWCCRDRNGCTGGAHLGDAAGDQLWANWCGVEFSEGGLHLIGGRRNDGGVLGGGVFVAKPESFKINEGERAEPAK